MQSTRPLSPVFDCLLSSLQAVNWTWAPRESVHGSMVGIPFMQTSISFWVRSNLWDVGSKASSPRLFTTSARTFFKSIATSGDFEQQFLLSRSWNSILASKSGTYIKVPEAVGRARFEVAWIEWFEYFLRATIFAQSFTWNWGDSKSDGGYPERAWLSKNCRSKSLKVAINLPDSSDPASLSSDISRPNSFLCRLHFWKQQNGTR